ncbi:MAG: ATP-dependent DNA helicase RecG [Euzebyales bacterium]|nr:ATP-dependent DNA helicase RecG [Euzebyales bacterium]
MDADRGSQLHAPSWLDARVGEVEGVSARAARTLSSALGIETVRDLLEHYPRQGRYRDIGAYLPLADAPLGEAVTLVGTIRGWQVVRPRGRRMTIAKARLADDGGGQVEVPLFNQEWRAKQLPPGARIAASGVLERFRGTLQLRNARVVALDAEQAPSDAERIVATYPATEALPSPRIARYVAAALDRLPPLPDHLPDSVRRRRRLLDLDTAVRTIHRPADLADIEPARRRLVYDELLCLQLGLQQRRHRLESDAAGLSQGRGGDGPAAAFLAALPFAPTGDQLAAMAEIDRALARPKPMHRLLQGEVGSGKTLIAAVAMLSALEHGHQAVLMAPTAVLAEQHARTLTRLLAPIGVGLPGGPRLELLTGGMSASRLRGLLAELAVGDVQLVVGTHALLEDRVQLPELGLVVVDEQHRFGVEHRTRLRDKRADGRWPDILVMTATPIPRSLALTVYGDLDVTVIRELPGGRQAITTQVIASDSGRRAGLYAFMRERFAAGERAYVVCPLIDASEALDIANATEVHARLAGGVFSDVRVELVHGRQPAAERDAAMDAFRRGDAQVLVSTTVIEVGVDVPEATVMVVEDADRFGISQLHQLRGRVGRGAARSYCVLFSDDPEGNPRLRALADTSDGFALAELDLMLRGEGSLFDTRQSGLPDLKIASLASDLEEVSRSREDARELVEADPDLSAHPALAGEVRRRYGDERLAALDTG